MLHHLTLPLHGLDAVEMCLSTALDVVNAKILFVVASITSNLCNMCVVGNFVADSSASPCSCILRSPQGVKSIFRSCFVNTH